MVKKRNKSGLSNIVATLIIILLVLVAVAIIWAVIKAFLIKSSDELTLSKFTVDLKIDSVRIANDSVSVKVKRNPGEGDLKGITFLIFDGQNTKIIEKRNTTLQPLERKTFVLDYNGPILKISIAPMFETDSGKIITGSITDVYYVNGGSGLGGPGSGTGGTGNESGNCTSDCGLNQCGPVPNGCGTSCGSCPPETPNCQNGICTSNPCTANCSCAQNTCFGQTCIGGCGESCPGELTLEQDCGSLMCGDSPHGCGICADCDTGYHCDTGICVVSCVPDCGARVCGPVPNECGTSCGSCDIGAGEWCNDGVCDSNPCVPDCGIKECGPVPNGCQRDGGTCGTCNGTEFCTSEGLCSSETYLNAGTVYSVWPINIGIYFDSSDFPTEGVDYTDYYVKFTTGSESRCLQIREFVTPVIPAIYNMSYVRFVTSSTAVQPGNDYEIWRTYELCTM